MLLKHLTESLEQKKSIRKKQNNIWYMTCQELIYYLMYIIMIGACGKAAVLKLSLESNGSSITIYKFGFSQTNKQITVSGKVNTCSMLTDCSCITESTDVISQSIGFQSRNEKSESASIYSAQLGKLFESELKRKDKSYYKLGEPQVEIEQATEIQLKVQIKVQSADNFT